MKSLLIFLLTLNVLAEDKHNKIHITGKCEKELHPDRTKLSLTIQELDMNQNNSYKTATNRYNQLVKEVKNLKLKDFEIATTNYSVHPKKAWENRKNVFKGYLTTISLDISTSQLQRTGEIFKLAAKHKSENVSGPTPFISQEKHKNEYKKCLVTASRDAKEKARILAKENGVKLGKVIEVIESRDMSSPAPRPPIRMEKMAMAMEASNAPTPSIEYAKQNLLVTLRVLYSIN